MPARIVDPENVPASSGSRGETTIGELTVHRIHDELGAGEVQVNVIFFEPGARFRPHQHPYDQILHYVKGTGVVAIDGGEDQIVPEGSFAYLPAGVPHMHGATEDGPAVHVSTMRIAEPGVSVTDFACAIPDTWRGYRA